MATGETRTIELDVEAVEAFETDAKARGMNLRAFLAEVALSEAHAEIGRMRAAGTGRGFVKAIAKDVQTAAEFDRTREGVPFEEVKAWMNSWGTDNELPVPKLRKL